MPRLFGQSESASVDPDLARLEALFRAYFPPMRSMALGITRSRHVAPVGLVEAPRSAIYADPVRGAEEAELAVII